MIGKCEECKKFVDDVIMFADGDSLVSLCPECAAKITVDYMVGEEEEEDEPQEHEEDNIKSY